MVESGRELAQAEVGSVIGRELIMGPRGTVAGLGWKSCVLSGCAALYERE